MQKIFIFLFSICFCNFSHATFISEPTRREYALKFHEAFVLQSIGESTQAFYRFSEAFNLGTSAGESPHKLQVVADLFYWYRQHGSCTRLFGRQPSSRERIDLEYCNCGKNHTDPFCRGDQKPSIAVSQHESPLAAIPNYRSKFRTHRQQAVLVREFMIGTGEIIAGIFVYVSQSTTTVYSGIKIIWNCSNSLGPQHEGALLKLKSLTDRAAMVSTQ